MKNAILIALLATSAHAADWTTLRRIGQAAGCAASMVDAKTTFRAGLIETNPLYGVGRPQVGRIVGIKLGFCGAQVAYSEYRHFRYRHEAIGPHHDADVTREKIGFVGALGQAGYFAYLAGRNSAIQVGGTK
jgi:hypothetical protein